MPPLPPSRPGAGRRRALLIGIDYVNAHPDVPGAGVGVWATLEAQDDARNFGRFLIEHRGWNSKDITYMLDSDECALELWPTKENIRQQIMLLVRNARAGDHFIFFYAGHSDQLESDTRSEVDGQDEVIIPCDCDSELERGCIIDNELKRTLVDPLPAGASLTAIFDSCHSGTLLDLEHDECNAIYVPWVSKGDRKSRTLWDARQRNLAAWNPMSLARWNPMSSARWQFPSLGPRALAAKASGCALPSPLSPLALALARAGPPSARASRASRVFSFWPSPAHRRLSHPPAPRRDSARGAPGLILAAAFLTDAPEAMCLSPEREYPCDGMCKHPSAEERGDVARVVCLSACGDPERAWEMRDDKASVRQTMTSALISVLESAPDCTYHTLLSRLSHCLYKVSLDRHTTSRGMRRWVNAKPGRVAPCPSEEMDRTSFQNPQLSSHYRLDMNDLFIL